jgi:hypothetical protein
MPYPDAETIAITGHAQSDCNTAPGFLGGMERSAMIGAKLDVQTAVDYGTVIGLETP